MRYGLPKEEMPKSKKKWKSAVENELKSLKMEVCILKEQLDEATKKLSEFTSSRPPDPFAFMQGFSRKENTMSMDMIPFAPIGERPRYESTWDYDFQAKKAVRYNSITCMPNYAMNEKSFEELRHEDYVLKGIGFSNQIQRYKDAKLRSLRTERNIFSFTQKNWKPVERKSPAVSNDGVLQSSFIIPWYLTPKAPKAPWPFGPPTVRSDLCITKPNSLATNKDSPSTSDVTKDTKCEATQNKTVTTSSFKGKRKTKDYSDVGTLNEDEHFPSQLLSEIMKMGEKMSSISDQLLKMDSNISNVSSRVSMMDSRLSAVDMFITMQRFDKKWQELETRLAVLETPSPTKFEPLPKEELNRGDKADNIHLKKSMPSEKRISENKVNRPSPESVDETLHPLTVEKSATPKSNVGKSSCTIETSDINISDFVRSISCTDVTMERRKRLNTFSSLGHSSLSDSSSNIMDENATIEMTDFKSNSLPSEPFFMENLSTEKESSKISCSEPVALVSAKLNNARKRSSDEPLETSLIRCIDTAGLLEENKLEQEPEQRNSFEEDAKSGKITNVLLSVTEKINSPINPDCSNQMVGEEIINDEEEFVIVEKSDVNETFGECSNSKKASISSTEYHSHEVPANSELKMYNDITEYLEINLGKKKNLVYEFGFEAKPDCVLESEDQSVETQANKAESSSKEDSFHLFKTNFIANESVDAKQSSPMVLFDSKTPVELPGKNLFWKK